ncbi:MAG: hypothetical protein AAFX78_12290 [Cyanobacteria bacterium J06638_20]
MDTSFFAAAAITLVLMYLSPRSPAILSLLFFVLAFFMLLVSFFLAPSWIKTLVFLAGWGWASYLCKQNHCSSP